MKDNYIISKMSLAEVQTAIDWASVEGWNPGLNDAQCFFTADPSGFFAGKLNNEIIAVGSAVIYDDNYAFCGLYIVKPGYRNQQYGIQLTKARLSYLGTRTTGIDGVLNMTNKYALIGYKTSYQQERYQLNAVPIYKTCAQIIPLTAINFSQLLDYDRQYFPSPRANFLDAWIKQPNAIALAFVKDGVLLGYGVIRKCVVGAKIGPLFAETPIIANHLFLALVNTLNVTPVFLDIPKPNSFAVKLVNDYKMEAVFATNRMYRNGNPKLNLNNIYGITSFELG